MRAAGEVMRQRIVRGIQELTIRNNRPPTNRELGEYLGGKSTGHIDYHLRILREQGVLMHDPKKSRGIMLRSAAGRSEAASTPAAQPRMLRIPLRGRIAAGAPIEAIEDRDEYVDIASSVPRGEEVFALRVKGKSMIEDLIDDNDIVVVRAQQTAQDGDMVAVGGQALRDLLIRQRLHFGLDELLDDILHVERGREKVAEGNYLARGDHHPLAGRRTTDGALVHARVLRHHGARERLQVANAVQQE